MLLFDAFKKYSYPVYRHLSHTLHAKISDDFNFWQLKRPKIQLAEVFKLPKDLQLLRSYLTNRSQRVRAEDVTSDISYENSGAPQGSVLGPLLFNIFINDLYFISSKRRSFLTTLMIISYILLILIQLSSNTVVCEWFRNNKMILNPEKCKVLVLSRKPNVKLSLFAEGVALPLLDTVDLFGLTFRDNSLNFGKHITKISKKGGKQLDVLCRLKNILSFRTKLCIYDSFVMSHFHYCSSIWYNCLKSDSKKLGRLHERALRYLYSDESSQTSTLCDRIGYSLVDRGIQNLLIIVFKTINNYPPEYLSDLFRLKDNIKNLRGLKCCKYRNLIRLVMARTQ